MTEPLGHCPFDAARPPFRVIPGQSAADAAIDIVASFGLLSQLSTPVQSTYAALARSLRDATWSEPLHRAARTLAALADGETMAFDMPPYHGTRHYSEVMLCCGFLARLHGLAGHAAQTVLLAALIHDLAHDGGDHPPFVMERASFARALPALQAASVASEDVARLGWLVLATEPNEGLSSALASLQAGPAAACGSAVAPVPELRHAADASELARMASVLCEADVLPSVGLTCAHALCLQDRLAREWHRPLGLNDKLDFADRLLARGVIGSFFRPNVEAMRGRLAESLDERAG